MRILVAVVAPLLLWSVVSIPAFAGDKVDLPRERGKPTDAQKNALEGKVPPKLEVSGWLNTDGKPLTWESLRGKVVVIDFWGTW